MVHQADGRDKDVFVLSRGRARWLSTSTKIRLLNMTLWKIAARVPRKPEALRLRHDRRERSMHPRPRRGIFIFQLKHSLRSRGRDQSVAAAGAACRLADIGVTNVPAVAKIFARRLCCQAETEQESSKLAVLASRAQHAAPYCRPSIRQGHSCLVLHLPPAMAELIKRGPSLPRPLSLISHNAVVLLNLRFSSAVATAALPRVLRGLMRAAFALRSRRYTAVRGELYPYRQLQLS